MPCCCANGQAGRLWVNPGDPAETNTALEMLAGL